MNFTVYCNKTKKTLSFCIFGIFLVHSVLDMTSSNNGIMGNEGLPPSSHRGRASILI